MLVFGLTAVRLRRSDLVGTRRAPDRWATASLAPNEAGGPH
jgi:hypothetical protein